MLSISSYLYGVEFFGSIFNKFLESAYKYLFLLSFLRTVYLLFTSSSKKVFFFIEIQFLSDPIFFPYLFYLAVLQW